MTDRAYSLLRITQCHSSCHCELDNSSLRVCITFRLQAEKIPISLCSVCLAQHTCGTRTNQFHSTALRAACKEKSVSASKLTNTDVVMHHSLPTLYRQSMNIFSHLSQKDLKINTIIFLKFRSILPLRQAATCMHFLYRHMQTPHQQVINHGTRPKQGHESLNLALLFSSKEKYLQKQSLPKHFFNEYSLWNTEPFSDLCCRPLRYK